MKLGFLKKFVDLDRNDPEQQLQTMFYHSETVVSKIANDLKEGGKIEKEVTLAVYNKKALFEDGNHRIAAAVRAGKDDDFEIPTNFKFLGKLRGAFKEKEHKFKTL